MYRFSSQLIRLSMYKKKIPASQNKMYIPAYTWRLGENQRPRIVHDLNVKCSTHVLFLGPQLAVIFWKTVETSVNYRSGSLGWAPQVYCQIFLYPSLFSIQPEVSNFPLPHLPAAMFQEHQVKYLELNPLKICTKINPSFLSGPSRHLSHSNKKSKEQSHQNNSKIYA